MSEGERENDYFIIKPSVMWAAATTQTLLRSSLCGSACVCLCAYPLVFAFTSCRAFFFNKESFLCLHTSMRNHREKGRWVFDACLSFSHVTGRILSEGQTLSFNDNEATQVLACFSYILLSMGDVFFQRSVVVVGIKQFQHIELTLISENLVRGV